MAEQIQGVPDEIMDIRNKVEPLFEKVIVWPCDVQYTDKESLLIRPDIAQDSPETGVVVAVAPDCSQIAAGDVVLFGKYSGYGLADDLLFSIREKDVMMRLHGVKVEPRGEKDPTARANTGGSQLVQG